MPVHIICQWFHRQLRETLLFPVTRHDAGRRGAVRSPNLEESISNVVADRRELSTRVVVLITKACSVAARRRTAMTIKELKSSLVQEWMWLPKGLIRNMVNNIKHRCDSYMAFRGDHTPY
ncbi:hypothetical protein TNCV_2291431 [Trichonephila clavipes]|uniref:Uncharacterized protein n=1 Tax=Trichonephila clavipes TaxID=2585209 RepID=A0A8X6RTL0_TRICX|nr:hypothetical protein TNCV_2291431 [Trichonephila clavipes]